MLSSPAVVNGVVYVGSDDNNTYALNATTGAKLWNYTTGSEVYSSPAVTHGTVYVGGMPTRPPPGRREDCGGPLLLRR